MKLKEDIESDNTLRLLKESRKLCSDFFEECDLNDLENVKELVQDYSDRNPFVAKRILEGLISQDEPEAVSAALETGIYSDTSFLDMREFYIRKACTPNTCKNSFIPLMKYCSELGFSVKQKEALYKIPLSRAVKTNDCKLVSLIFAEGVYANCNDDEVDFLYGYLNDVIKSGYVDMARLLLEYFDFANWRVIDILNSGLAAIEQQNSDLLSVVLEQANFRLAENNSIHIANRMLSGAVEKRDADLLEVALAHGADPCFVNPREFTYVSPASTVKAVPHCTDIAVVLLLNGADLCYSRGEDVMLDPGLLGQVFDDG